jgi:photosystem II stability/assembly factor-like uncharacterized protein
VTSRRAYLALAALLLAGCTSHPTASPTPAPTTPSRPPATSPPAATPAPTAAAPAPYDPHDPRCRVTGAAGGADGTRPFAFAGPSVGVVALGALLWRTIDGGATWEAGHELAGEPTDIVSAGCQTLYASTWGAEVLRSDDAGETWTRRGDLGVTALAFVTPDVGYGLRTDETEPYPTRLYATKDGARTWRRVFAVGAPVASVAADRTRLLVGVDDGILRSTDGGAHLTRLLTTGMAMHVALAPGGAGGWAVGFRTVHYKPEYAAWYSPDLLHWRRIAGGRVQDHSGNYPPSVHSLTGVGATYGAASAMFPGTDGRRGSVTVTTDGGRTLRRVFVGPAGDYYAPRVSGIQWVDATHAYATVTDGRPLVYGTADAGRTWKELSL